MAGGKETTIHLLIRPEHEGQRLDRWLASQQPELSRSHIQKRIGDGAVLVNGKSVRSSYRVVANDEIDLTLLPPEPTAYHPEEIPLDIFFEDEHVLVVNKPSGMTVHPAPGTSSGTLVNALLGHCPSLSGINGVQRPGIVHRLDRDTSGLLMVAKTDLAHRGLAEQIEARTVVRRYDTLIWGQMEEDRGRIEAPIGRHASDRTRMAVRADGRFAATEWSVIARYNFTTRLSVRLETGRTHQIRVHLLHIQRPVLGDPTYGGRDGRLRGIAPMFRRSAQKMLRLIDRQMLHAGTLGFVHPINGEKMLFEAKPPDDMQGVFDWLREDEASVS